MSFEERSIGFFSILFSDTQTEYSGSRTVILLWYNDILKRNLLRKRGKKPEMEEVRK